MTREIKFRGKAKDGGEWFYGSHVYLRDSNSHHIIACGTYKPAVDAFDVGQVEVDPATVGQCTGVKDKAGRDIYEGDILMFYPFCCEYLQEFHVVGYCEDYGFCQIEYYDKERNGKVVRRKRDDPRTLFGLSYGTIIGNIHDNPGILKTYEQ